MNYLKYPIVLTPEDEGGFTVTVPDLPGCITYGKSLEEAKEKAVEAIEGFLEAMKKVKKNPIYRSERSVFDVVVLNKQVKKSMAVCS